MRETTKYSLMKEKEFGYMQLLFYQSCFSKAIKYVNIECYIHFQVHQLLEDILSQWDSYHNELQVVNQTLAETEYCLQRYNLIGGDIATLKIQVEKLEVS